MKFQSPIQQIQMVLNSLSVQQNFSMCLIQKPYRENPNSTEMNG